MENELPKCKQIGCKTRFTGVVHLNYMLLLLRWQKGVRTGPDGYPLPDPTRTFFFYPNRTRKFFQNFRVQGSSYICHY